MNKYSELTDEELIKLMKGKDEGVVDFMMNKYKNLVRKKAMSMFILGADREDLIQEGMIGLYKAIRDYDSSQVASFITFADLCVSRQMYSAIERAGRMKHAPLNSYVSIYEDDFNKEGGSNPEEEFLDKEAVLSMEESFDTELSELERKVLNLMLTGMDYTQIAAVIGKSPKSTDNAIQRAKAKLRRAWQLTKKEY